MNETDEGQYVGDCAKCKAKVVDCCGQCERCRDCCHCGVFGSPRRETHRVVDIRAGVAHGCAHSYEQERAYVDSGRTPNPECPNIQKWNTMQ